MADVNQYVFSFQELVEALIKKQGVHEGIWGPYIKFGLGAANVSALPGGPLQPAAIIPVQEIGIQRFDEPNNMTVNAAEVNPRSATKTSAKKGRKGRK